MRLFVALWPPPEVVAHLETAVTGAAAQGLGESGLNWTSSAQFHLTLAFLGEVGVDRRPEVEERLARVARRNAPLTVQFAGAGRFGDRVLFVKVAGEVDRLRRLAESAAAAARRARVDMEDRPFRAHLTIARARSRADLRPFVSAMSTYRSAVWTAAELHLVESRLGAGPGGRAAYATVAAWPLTGAERPGRNDRDRIGS